MCDANKGIPVPLCSLPSSLLVTWIFVVAFNCSPYICLPFHFTSRHTSRSSAQSSPEEEPKPSSWLTNACMTGPLISAPPLTASWYCTTCPPPAPPGPCPRHLPAHPSQPSNLCSRDTFSRRTPLIHQVQRFQHVPPSEFPLLLYCSHHTHYFAIDDRVHLPCFLSVSPNVRKGGVEFCLLLFPRSWLSGFVE